MKIKFIAVSIFITGLIYIIIPEPAGINDFSGPADFLKSDEPGDTVQVPNVAAYFSQFDRSAATSFYRKTYQEKFPFMGKFIPPLSLNHPPQNARVNFNTEAYFTFLEEYVYPLRGSLMVAGYEPYIDNEIRGKTHNFISDHIHINGSYFVSKTKLRYFPAHPIVKTLVYVGIWLSLMSIWSLWKKVAKE